MIFSWPRGLNLLLAVGLSALMAFPQGAIAQDHAVSSSDVKKDLQAATAERRKQLAQVDGFLATSEAKKALAEAHVDYQQVHAAVQSLSDEDLARVAARADQAQKDFAAGTLSDRDLILIILGIAVLVLIIVAVR
jgi:adenylosuccinate lyase